MRRSSELTQSYCESTKSIFKNGWSGSNAFLLPRVAANGQGFSKRACINPELRSSPSASYERKKPLLRRIGRPGGGVWTMHGKRASSRTWPHVQDHRTLPVVTPVLTSVATQHPGQRDLLRANVPPVKGAWRSVARTIDHGPSAVKLDNFAAVHMPE